jgi:hypothetical protein
MSEPLQTVGDEPVPWKDYPRCPDCGCETRWQLGPRGGLSVNIHCCNCGCWFNAMLGLTLIHRIRHSHATR